MPRRTAARCGAARGDQSCQGPGGLVRLPFSGFFKLEDEASRPQHSGGHSGLFLRPQAFLEICAITLSRDALKAIPGSGYVSPEQELLA